MPYEFTADSIEIGDDEGEEVYTVTFTETDPGGGPARGYLLFQRSVAGIDDPDLIEPYIELTDPANGRFGDSIVRAELLPTYFHIIFADGSGITPHPGSTSAEIDEMIVRFDADGPTLRRLKYALELVIADGFEWTSMA